MSKQVAAKQSDADVISLRPSQLAALLQRAIPAREPVLVVGSPGVGKSAIIEQAARAVGFDVVLSHPAIEDPTDAKGIPFINNGTAEFYLAGQLARVMRATTPTLWFIDDLGQAPMSVQAPYMQWLLARECGGHRLPDCVSVIAATNKRTDRSGVQGLLEAVKSRFTTIVELRPNFEDFKSWAYTQSTFSSEVLAYLTLRPGNLWDFQPGGDMSNFPCPRTFHALSRLVNMALPREIEHAVFSGAVGEKIAVEFIPFLRDARDMPDPEAVLADPKNAPVPKAPSTLYALVTALAYRAGEGVYRKAGRTLEKTAEALAAYAERLLQAEQGEFGVLLVAESYRVNKNIATAPAFIKLYGNKKMNGFLTGVAVE